MKIKTLFTLVILSICAVGYSQEAVAIVDYMKVKPQNDGDYLEVEKEWKKIHQERVDQGIITSWQLWQKMYSGAADPYQYITVAVYDDFKKTENPLPWDWMMENYSEEERNKMMDNTGKARTMVATEVYFQFSVAENGKPSTYMFVNRMKVKPGKGSEYRKFEDELVRPLFEEAITRGYRASWSAWSKWLANDEFQIVTADGYDSYGQWNEQWDSDEMMEKVHPGKSVDDVMGGAGELRVMKSRELWKLIDVVGAPPQD